MAQLFRTLAILLGFFLMLFVYSKVFGPIPFAVNNINTNKNDTFQVNGEGKIFIIPDIVVINAGITAEGATVKEVRDKVNSTINKVSAALKELGVEEKDIQTQNYSIHPTYDYTGGSQKIVGFNANTTLNIKVRDLDKANQAVDLAVNNGANQLGGVSFDISDRSQALDQAREKAVEEAKRKASIASQTAGFKLGKIINYSENSNNLKLPAPLSLRSDALGSPEKATLIEPGSTEIRLVVTLSYEIF